MGGRRGGINGGVAIVDMLSFLLCNAADLSFIEHDVTELSIADVRLLGSTSFTTLRDLFSRLAASDPFFNSDFSF